jgi:hypothetical protein
MNFEINKKKKKNVNTFGRTAVPAKQTHSCTRSLINSMWIKVFSSPFHDVWGPPVGGFLFTTT